jgi:para-nitrobenzyl esterase
MKKTLLLLFVSLIISEISSSQCTEGRYRNFIFSDFNLTADIQYGTNLNEDGSSENLLMDIYEPAGDTEINRPLVIVCHGGYFLGGDKAAVDVVQMCEDLSKMGYVVASINYRIGIPISIPLQVPYGQAVVRAVQDLRAAIRWFRKDAAENGNEYNIDANQIYVGGDSAGGFMALHHAYMDESDLPTWLDMTGTGMAGGMEGESGNPGYSSDVNAIFSVSGALGDVNWIDETDTTPACLFHGDNDQTITIDSGMFVLFSILDVTEIDGSNPIDARMNELGITHCYHITQDGGHVPYLESVAVFDTTLSIITNFLSHYICGVELDCEYRLVTAVEKSELAKDGVFPNPCAAGSLLRTKNPYQKAIAHWIDLQGRTVATSNAQGNSIRVPSSMLPGIYFLKIEADLESEVHRIVVE